MKHPVPPSQVKKLVVTILARGTVAFTGHAYEEMRKDGLVETDVVNVLRGGATSKASTRTATGGTALSRHASA